jgi:hypothetical protein
VPRASLRPASPDAGQRHAHRRIGCACRSAGASRPATRKFLICRAEGRKGLRENPQVGKYPNLNRGLSSATAFGPSQARAAPHSAAGLTRNGTRMAETAKEIIQVNLEDEMRKSYLDYAMSVIVGARSRMRATASSRCIAACCSR